MKNDNSNIKTLFLTFLKIGVFTFGGGYAMIALLETEFCVRKNWLDKKEFLDMTAISESTPGPTAVNSATYIGYKIGGVLGALAATVGVCIPSFIIIYIISLFFDKFLSLKVVYAGFRGIQVGVIYLILTAGLRMLKALDNTLLDKIIMFGVFIMMILFTLFSVKFSSVFYIIISGAVGIAVYLIKTLGWLSEDEFVNFIAVSESTPGPLAVNMATFVGSSQAGFIGGLIATLGVVLPSFVIIFIIASIMKDLLKYSGVKAMLSGIRPCVVAMILATGITMALSSLLNITTINSKPAFDYKALIIFLLIALADVLLLKLKKFKLSPITIIVSSAFLGIIFY